MAHFAEIKNGIVQRVIVVHDNEETNGIEFCKNLLGGEWLQCSYNNRIRKQFPSAGYSYDKTNDVFIAPKPYPSWLLNASHDWQAPTVYPNDGKVYLWDETSINWILEN